LVLAIGAFRQIQSIAGLGERLKVKIVSSRESGGLPVGLLLPGIMSRKVRIKAVIWEISGSNFCLLGHGLITRAAGTHIPPA
jgi:hypothetical protein